MEHNIQRLFKICQYFEPNCQICFSSFYEGMVICVLCKVKVHLSCYYGEDSHHKLKDDTILFRCQRCEIVRKKGLEINQITCKFCPYLEGAMKQVWYKDNKTKKFWSHLCCVNLQPNLYFTQVSENVNIAPNTEISKWQKIEFYKKCYICKIFVGITLQCNYRTNKRTRCKNGFHPICGYKKKILKYMLAIRSIFINPDYEYDFFLYCQMHLKMMLVEKRNILQQKIFPIEIQLDIMQLFREFNIQGKQIENQNLSVASKSSQSIKYLYYSENKLNNSKQVSPPKNQFVSQNSKSRKQITKKMNKQSEIQKGVKTEDCQFEQASYQSSELNMSKDMKKKENKIKILSKNKMKKIQEIVNSEDYSTEIFITKQPEKINQIYVGYSSTRCNSMDFVVPFEKLKLESSFLDMTEFQSLTITPIKFTQLCNSFKKID